jgi:PAS domain S-box-containing protein
MPDPVVPETPPVSAAFPSRTGITPSVRILSQADLRATFSGLEASGVFGAFEWDIVSQILSGSPEIFRRHGLSPEASNLRFDEVWERIWPGDRDRVRRAAIEGMATGHLSAVYRVQPPSSPLRWMQMAAILQRSPSGDPLRWVGIVLDAAPAIVADTLHQEARNQVVELVESIAESFIALDRDFRFTYVNQQVCEKTGKTRDQIIGQSVWDLFPAAASTEFYAGYQRVAQERVRHSFLVHYPQPDGSQSWFEAHAFPTAEGMAALIRDVTELKRAREALEASEERFRRAQQAANIGAFEWNLNTNQLTWAAKVPTFTEVADTDDFTHYLRFVDEADRSAILAAIGRVLAGGQHAHEVRVHPPDGRTLWFYFCAEAVFAEGKPVRVYGIAMDITERKQGEEALRNSEKIAATGKLAATIAHEINNPLEAVTNLLFLARDASEPGSPAHRFLHQAEDELERVAAIVRQTLTFYRGTSIPISIDLASLVGETLALFERRFSARNIQVVTTIADPVAVLAIEGEVRQIFTNLVANALDAVEPGGSIWITLDRENTFARLLIRDNGHGIPPDVMEQLFQPLFTTRTGSGTGLGLWVSRELARKNAGTIECSSPGLGQGATFILSLPVT